MEDLQVISQSIEELYDIYEDIGSGHFAVVRRCVEKATRTEYAAKYIKKRRVASSRRGLPIDLILREVEVLRILGTHPNIISLHQVFDNGQNFILVLELVRGGELFEHISEKERLSEEEATLFVRQILEGVQHMHSMSIVHLDLKPENVLLLSKNHHKIKLIDFGLSRKIQSNEDVREIMGTAEFVAPEIISYESLSLATDMWATGVITFILLSGTSPFIGDTKQDIYNNISAVDYSFDEDLFSEASELAKDFISKLLVKDPKQRMTAEASLCHPWISPQSTEQKLLIKQGITNIKNLKSYQARHRWKHSVRVITLCNRLSRSAKLRSQSGELLDAKSSTITLQEDKDASFVLSAMVAAIEEGNTGGLENLFNVAQNINVNITNKHNETALHLAGGLGQMEILQFLVKKGANLDSGDALGDTPLHWAARQGHSQAVALLIEQGAQINVQNKQGESCLHVACRYGHTVVVQNLCLCNMNIDLQDDHGETALHVAVWHGFPQIVLHLCSASANTELVDTDNQTPLHIAANRGHLECVQGLISSGACVDPQDNQGATPLHLSLRRHHTQVAMLLLHAGANTDLTDEAGEAPIHIASREGFLSLAQTLCAFGCSVDLPNREGLYPLHLAAKNGHTELVRCLCLAGCLVEQKSRDGILAEVSAMAQGYDDIAELLNRLRNDQQREEFIQQLIPTGTCLPRIKVKLLGNSGAGKSALVESLKAGYFSSFFRRSKSVSSPNTNTGSSQNSTNTKKNQIFKGHIEMESPLSSRQSSLEYQFHPSDNNYTKGIDVQQVNISGVGDLSIWDFSGHEAYFSVYDHFIGNSTCVHLIVFPIHLPFHIQLQQATFWLSFLQARIPPTEPLGYRGKPNKICRVALVATHADLSQCHKTIQGEYVAPQLSMLQEKLMLLYGDIFEIHNSIFVLEATASGSFGVKALKNYLSSMKTKLTQGWKSTSVSYAVQGTVSGDGYTILQSDPGEDVPRVTGFLNALVLLLVEWRSSVIDFPVVSWSQFVDIAHERVNPLAGEEHLKEVVTQLQLLGEVVYLKAGVQDLVVLDPPWLTAKQIGLLLSHEYSSHARVTGCYTVDDFQMSFPDCDALDLLQALEALHLCTQCDNEGEIEYEFPCFNKVETLDGLWDQSDPRYVDGVYGGVRLKSPAPTPQLLPPIYTRIQVQLRRSWQEYPECDTDLYQWNKGSKFCSGPLEALITLEEGGEAVEVKVRGPQNSSSVLFFFMEDLLAMVDQVMVEMCPGLVLEKHVMSVEQLQQHATTVYAWSPPDIYSALLADGIDCKLKNPLTLKEESFTQFVCLGSQDVVSSIVIGRDIHISTLCTVTIQKLCSLLDMSHPRGSDWCVLAVKLGLQNLLPTIDTSQSSILGPKLSPTASLLNAWGQNASATLGELIKVLKEMEREDVVVALVTGSPLYLLAPPAEDSASDTPPISSASATSTSNLSR